MYRLLPFLVLSCGTGESSPPDPATTGGTSGDLPCSSQIVPALDWWGLADVVDWTGRIEFGQTHIVKAAEGRQAPKIAAERETLLLFRPTNAIDAETDVRVAAFDGETLLGVLALQSPDAFPAALEQGLTPTELQPYSDEHWSAFLPWSWMREGVELRIAHLQGTTQHQKTTTLSKLKPPQITTLTRSKTMIFGQGDEDLNTLPISTLAQDHFSTLPGAELRVVDVTPWRLESVVVNTDEGPRLVHSEGERQDLTNSPDRWDLLKYQISLRHNLANTGRGLGQVGESYGDSSPYSYGTSLGLGWVVNDDGSWTDINDAPYAAGWTGWSAIWLSECGNTIAHELGHSYSLAHFTDGTAEAWGIAEEYPNDGVNLATHPWGYDTTRRAPRTWYKVSSAGPVEEGGAWVGKGDPMNGGDSPNALHCYPQYTAYTAQWIQDWATGAPNLMNVDGTPGAYVWDDDARAYAEVDPPDSDGPLVAVDVDVLTLVGTLGNTDEACQTYPARRSSLGNVFALPEPNNPDLPSLFDGAQWFVEVTYADGSMERGLIAQGAIDSTDTSMSLYSFNLQADRMPESVHLYRSPTGHPGVDVAGAELIHERIIESSSDPVTKPVRVGRGYVANGPLTLDQLCTPGVDCEGRQEHSTWRGATSQRHFSHADVGETQTCMASGDHSVLSLPAVEASGSPVTLVAHAQRVLRSGARELAVPLNDITPWLGAPDLEQSLRIWLPYAENAALAPGHYTLAEAVEIEGLLDGSPDSSTPIQVDLQVYELTDVDFTDLSDGYWTDPVYQAGSSVYFTVSDPSMGPTWGDWWNASELSNTLWAVVVSDETGEVTTLTLDANKVACGDWWGFNTGQSADWDCDNQSVIVVNESANNTLVSGQTYRSPGSSPLVIQARRWHAPNAGEILAEFPIRVTYTAP